MDVQWHHTLWDGYLDRNTNVFQCATNGKMGKVLKHWRDKHDGFVGWEIVESSKEWNWSYGWNAAGEGSRENTLGTVPAQENPDDLSRRGEINWARETVIYISLKEHEIVAPSVMFIVEDRSGWRRYVTESGRGDNVLFVQHSVDKVGWFPLPRCYRKKTNMTIIDGHAGFVGRSDSVADKGYFTPLESKQQVH